jgi:hypothetical protein
MAPACIRTRSENEEGIFVRMPERAKGEAARAMAEAGLFSTVISRRSYREIAFSKKLHLTSDQVEPNHTLIERTNSKAQ